MMLKPQIRLEPRVGWILNQVLAYSEKLLASTRSGPQLGCSLLQVEACIFWG